MPPFRLVGLCSTEGSQLPGKGLDTLREILVDYCTGQEVCRQDHIREVRLEQGQILVWHTQLWCVAGKALMEGEGNKADCPILEVASRCLKAHPRVAMFDTSEGFWSDDLWLDSTDGSGSGENGIPLLLLALRLDSEFPAPNLTSYLHQDGQARHVSGAGEDYTSDVSRAFAAVVAEDVDLLDYKNQPLLLGTVAAATYIGGVLAEGTPVQGIRIVAGAHIQVPHNRKLALCRRTASCWSCTAARRESISGEYSAGREQPCMQL